MNRYRIPLRLLMSILLVQVIAGCATVPGTGRRQFMLLDERQERRLGLQAYQEILAKEKLSTDAKMNAVLNRVGQRIAAVADRPDFDWEFKLIESEKINAFCLPGGKVAVYTGILPIMKNEAGLAAVLGHEVAHAVARHGGERMSQHLGLAVVQEVMTKGMKGSSPKSRERTNAIFGISTKVGLLLPYSRAHELEADQLGLIFAAKAGYDPRESVPLWERMAKTGKKKPPEFLSTHPQEGRRIEKLSEQMPRAMETYRKSAKQYGLGEQWGGD